MAHAELNSDWYDSLTHLIRPRWRAEKKNSWSSQNRDEKWSKNEEKTTESKPVKDRWGERTEGQSKTKDVKARNFKGRETGKKKREREKKHTEFIRLELNRTSSKNWKKKKNCLEQKPPSQESQTQPKLQL